MKEEIMTITIIIFFIATLCLLLIIRFKNLDIRDLEKKLENRDKAINRLKQRLLRRNRKINKLTTKI